MEMRLDAGLRWNDIFKGCMLPRADSVSGLEVLRGRWAWTRSEGGSLVAARDCISFRPRLWLGASNAIFTTVETKTSSLNLVEAEGLCFFSHTVYLRSQIYNRFIFNSHVWSLDSPAPTREVPEESKTSMDRGTNAQLSQMPCNMRFCPEDRQCFKSFSSFL